MPGTTCAAVAPSLPVVLQGSLFTELEQSNYEKFKKFHGQFPLVYSLFEKFSLELIYKGHTKLGAKMIIERIRWELKTNSKDEEGFKINNNYTCWYSRMFVHNHPRYKDFFDFREVKN